MDAVESKPEVLKGLAGVLVDETAISLVEGEAGRLSYRGYTIENLSENHSYIETSWLVLFGALPSAEQAAQFEQHLVATGGLLDYEVAILKALPEDTHPMSMLQSLIPVVDTSARGDFELPINTDDAWDGIAVAAKVPALIAAFCRIRAGHEVVAPDSGLSFHGNFLNMLNDTKPSDDAVKTLDVTQILQMEHGFNASAFSLRVTASTLAPVETALSAAVGTLFGKLHGGADQACLQMAMEIGSPEKAKDYVLHKLAHKEKIMGMGHRVYRTIDPRARVLKPMAQQLCMGSKAEHLYTTLEVIEEVMREEMHKKEKEIWANVEFYKGAVMYCLGLPLDCFTAMFAMARIPGYLAHFLESREDNRLIRPSALYIGRKPDDA